MDFAKAKNGRKPDKQRSSVGWLLERDNVRWGKESYGMTGPGL